MFANINVSGFGANLMYKWLAEKTDAEVTEPFTKFLITRHGDIRKRFSAKDKL